MHTGEHSEVILEPVKELTGINFFVHETKIPVSVDNVVSTQNCTAIGTKDIKVFTIEHLLSAIFGLEITDLNIKIKGQEIPAYDGSAKEFVAGINKVGFDELNFQRELIFIKEEIDYKINDSYYEMCPSNNFELLCKVNYDVVGEQFIELKLDSFVYEKEISAAKTFCYYKDIEKIRAKGLGKGGSLDNVLIIGEKEIMNKEKMSYKDEIVRHKILDFLGDFSLLNKHLCCKINISNPSHYTNYEFIKYLKNKIF